MCNVVVSFYDEKNSGKYLKKMKKMMSSCSLVIITLQAKYLVVIAISVDFGPKVYKFRNYCLVNIK